MRALKIYFFIDFIRLSPVRNFVSNTSNRESATFSYTFSLYGFSGSLGGAHLPSQ